MMNFEQFLGQVVVPDKNILTVYKSEVVRSPKHLKFVKRGPCSIHRDGENCNGMGHPIDPHHLMNQGGHGMALKESDEWTVPLCRFHHNQVTVTGKEEKFWEKWDMSYEEAEQIAIFHALNSPCPNIRYKMLCNLKDEDYSDEDIRYMANVRHWM